MSGALEEARLAYAKTVLSSAEVDAPALLDAFARVPREHFLGPGPWMLAQPFDPEHPYLATPTSDPREILKDVLVGIDLPRQLNNGQPSAHARWMAAVLPRPGERALHVGCGVGYYSAILAELVGPAGKVHAVEVDAALAARAKTLLVPWPQVEASCSDALRPPTPLDVVYVNAGVTSPPAAWLDALTVGGRMLVPLTVHVPGFPHGVGAVFRLERSADGWSARLVSPVGIFDCVGARDERDEPALEALLDFETAAKVTALVRGPHPRGERCVVHLEGFCLQRGGG